MDRKTPPGARADGANATQVGGLHYNQFGAWQHWDMAWYFKLDPFQYQITKYVMRYRDKGGMKDLQKARHFLDKYMELLEADATPTLDAPEAAEPAGGPTGTPDTLRASPVVGVTPGAGYGQIPPGKTPDDVLVRGPHSQHWYVVDREALSRFDFQAAVKPDGWLGFGFHGLAGDILGSYQTFRCDKCRAYFKTAVGVAPYSVHRCEDANPSDYRTPELHDSGDPGRAYVDQDGGPAL